MPDVAPAPYRRLASTPWLDPARAGLDAVLAEVGRFTRRTWRLPTMVPASSAHHALSPRLPADAALVRLVRTLVGRFVVVNHMPVAAASRPEAALVRGLARAVFCGLPAAPWPAAARRASARWPADSRRAYEATLAAEWVRAHPEAALPLGRARRVALALYEAAPGVLAASAGGNRRADPALAAEAFVAASAYRLALFVDDAARPAVPAWDAADAQVARRAAEGGAAPERLWFVGQVLLPDTIATEAMDGQSRERWARVTGRRDSADRYWYPDSWARFLEPGRVAGCVSAADVLRSRPGQLANAGERPARGRRAALGPRVERGLCVPPGYCLVDCHGTMAVMAVRAD